MGTTTPAKIEFETIRRNHSKIYEQVAEQRERRILAERTWRI
jgi:hypothetical protein